jgi:signal transduction histidine kinase
MTVGAVEYNYSLDTNQLLLNLSQDLALQYNFSTASLSLSPSAGNFLGFSQENRDKLNLKKIIPHKYEEKVLEIFNYYKGLYDKQKALNGEAGQLMESELEIFDRDHYRKWVNILSKPMIDNERKCIGFHAFARDITYEKLLKQQFDYQRDLLNQIKSLQDSRVRLISTVNHEFRTPLAIIRSNLQTIQQFNIKNGAGKKAESALELIEQASERMLKMLDKMAVLSKGNHGKLIAEPEPVDIVGFCRHIATELNSLKEYASRVEILSDMGELFTLTDTYLLENILSNIIINALKYSPRNEKVWLGIASDRKKYIEIHILDKGIGIPEEELYQVFDEFFRASNVGETKGSGLGFAVVKQCIEALDGNISIKSKINEGTEVKIILPYQVLDEKYTDHRKRTRTRQNLAECS